MEGITYNKEVYRLHIQNVVALYKIVCFLSTTEIQMVWHKEEREQ